ncbi:MAG: glycosyl transferase family 1 [Chloroflexi bacterium HGW-Chloroflexi-10]|nr:MAG: glycosyl transferase family 1 [Chloroflexi bacterium HGW-Chloroflexi-10]
MFIFNPLQDNFQNFPIISPFEVRFKALIQKEKRVAYFYENPDNSTFRYRVYNMIEALSTFEDISASFFHNGDLDSLDKVIDHCDYFVICRSRYSEKLSRAILKAKFKGIPVIYDVDDIIFNIDYVHLIVNTLDQDLKDPNVWDFWFAYISRQEATLKLCDRSITTNSFIANKLREKTGKPVSIIPNFLNQEQINISNKIYQQKLDNKFSRDDSIYIGYFSGTPSHNRDFEIVASPLVNLLNEDPRIRVMIVGYLNIKGELGNYSSRFDIYPLQHFLKLQELIGKVELNIVPLQDNEFTNCKSELKYFDAGIVGTVSIATPIFSYRQSINDGNNGFLANSYEWYEKIRNVIDNLDQYSEFAQTAYNDSLTKFSWLNYPNVIRNVIFNTED